MTAPAPPPTHDHQGLTCATSGANLSKIHHQSTSITSSKLFIHCIIVSMMGTHISSNTSPKTPLASGLRFPPPIPVSPVPVVPVPVAFWKKLEKFSKNELDACSCSNSEAFSSVNSDEGLELNKESYSALLPGSDRT